MNEKQHFDYWGWFVEGCGGGPGYKRVVNCWFLGHLLIGTIVALLVGEELKSAANTVLLPLAGIFIGLTFAWAGNAQSLMQSVEIHKLVDQREGGFEEYVYTFQTAILVILVTLVLWGFAGLNIFDKKWPTHQCVIPYFIIKALLFSMASLTLRECWHVVIGAQWLLIAQKRIKEEDKTEQKKSSNDNI
jgi:hypothetical protein